VALSTTKFEYIRATHARNKVVWLQRLCLGIGFVQQAVRLYCVNQSEIFLEKNPSYHLKKNQIDVQYHFVRDITSKFGSFCNDYLDALATLCREYCDES
jgi:hypothetical protein